jgi:hypothetical protein
MTLVEVMVAGFILSTVMLGMLGTFLQSRRTTETAILQAATSSFIYGIVEQLKTLPYRPSTAAEDSVLPALTAADDTYPTGTGTVQQPLGADQPDPPNIRVRLNQDEYYWLRVGVDASGNLAAAPAGIPAANVAAATIHARDNWIKVRLSDASELQINIWVWVEELPPDPARDVVDVKQITLIYTYKFNDGRGERLVRDREVIMRTRFQN